MQLNCGTVFSFSFLSLKCSAFDGLHLNEIIYVSIFPTKILLTKHYEIFEDTSGRVGLFICLYNNKIIMYNNKVILYNIGYIMNFRLAWAAM